MARLPSARGTINKSIHVRLVYVCTTQSYDGSPQIRLDGLSDLVISQTHLSETSEEFSQNQSRQVVGTKKPTTLWDSRKKGVRRINRVTFLPFFVHQPNN